MQSLRISSLSRNAIQALLCILFCWMCIPARAEQITLEAALFKGGYGIDFYEKCAREFEQKHPNVKINLWGSPRVWDQLTPRFFESGGQGRYLPVSVQAE